MFQLPLVLHGAAAFWILILFKNIYFLFFKIIFDIVHQNVLKT
jgi:hypothetical protein